MAFRTIFALFLLTAASAASAQELNQANTAWILTSTALVLFMTIPGLSLFYAGLVRTKNVLSVLMQCFSITCVASIVWLLVGYSLAFTDGGAANAFIGGTSQFFFAGIMEDTLAGDIPESVFAMFQMTFAIITPALIVGAFAERMKFSAMLIFSVIWLVLVYAPICHWVWGGGWLGQMGLLDFAGGTVVHITAGVGALVAALVIGNRNGFPTQPMAPHNLTMCVTGAGMLWVGWFGFNGGSPFAANGDAVAAAFVTHISAATACVTWMIWERVRFGKASLIGIATGMVAGLASITPAAGHVGPMGALVIGGVAGILCQELINVVKQNFSVDDSLDVFAVHGVGGIWGTLALPFLAATSLGGAGLAEGVSAISQFVVQLAGVIAVAAFTVVMTVVLAMIARALVGMRTERDDEQVGLDLTAHGERAYDLS